MSSLNSPTFDKETVDVFSELHERLNESTDAVRCLSTLLNDSAAGFSSDELPSLISVLGNQLHRIRCDFEELLYKTNVSGPALQVQGLEAIELLRDWYLNETFDNGKEYLDRSADVHERLWAYVSRYGLPEKSSEPGADRPVQ